jgi:hypothetical protein
MWKAVIKPISQRLATVVGTVLTTAGMASEEVSTVEAAIPLLLGFAVDLVIRRLY